MELTPRLLKVEEAAIYVNRTPDEVYDMLTTGEIPFVPVGIRGKRVDRNDLDAWIEKSKIQRRVA